MEEGLFQRLESLLIRRLEIIADHAWRDRDSAGHLDELKRVSEELMDEHQRLATDLPPRLAHFLQNASYSKALSYLQGDTTSH